MEASTVGIGDKDCRRAAQCLGLTPALGVVRIRNRGVDRYQPALGIVAEALAAIGSQVAAAMLGVAAPTAAY